MNCLVEMEDDAKMYNDIDMEYVPEVPSGVMGFGDVGGRRYRKVYLCWLAFALVLTLIVYRGTAGLGWERAIRIGTFFGISLFFVHFFYVSSCRPVNYLAPDLLFTAAYTIFHFGYLVVWCFGVVPDVRKIFYAPSLYYRVLLIVNLGMVGFLMGYELPTGRRRFAEHFGVKKVPSPAWRIVGVVLMVLALIIHFWFIFKVGVRTFLEEGYRVSSWMQDYVADDRLWRLQPRIFMVGFSIYIVSVALEYKRLFYGKLGVSLFVLYLVLLFLEGGRTQLVTVGVVFILVRHYLIKPIKLKWLIACAIFSLFIFTALGAVRNITSFDAARMAQEYQHLRKAGEIHWYDPLVEMGGTVGTVNMTTSLVPSEESYWYGSSYISSIVHIIPYMQGLLGRYLSPGPSIWLTHTLFGTRAPGTGFSISGEGYLNFGFPGAFLQMVVIGLLMRYIYIGFSSRLSPARCLVFIASLGIFVVSVRNHTNLILAPLANIIVVAWLLKSLCGEREVLDDYEEPVLYEQEDMVEFNL